MVTITAYMLRCRGYLGWDERTVPVVNASGTVREIRWRGRLRFLTLRLPSGRRDHVWAYNLHLSCGHTKLVMQRRVRCWTTHARCGKCPRETTST